MYACVHTYIHCLKMHKYTSHTGTYTFTTLTYGLPLHPFCRWQTHFPAFFSPCHARPSRVLAEHCPQAPLYVYMYVCMHACMYACVCMLAIGLQGFLTCSPSTVHKPLCMYMYMCVCMYVCMCVYVDHRVARLFRTLLYVYMHEYCMYVCWLLMVRFFCGVRRHMLCTCMNNQCVYVDSR